MQRSFYVTTRGRRNTTIKDVARHAGVSTATVSRVLNGSPSVKNELVERVRLSVAQLGYHPNAAARTLKTKKANAIGILVPDISNPYFMQIIKGIEDVMSLDFSLLMASSDEDSKKETKLLNVLSEDRIDCLVVATAGGNDEVIRAIDEKGTPVVLVDRLPDSLANEMDSVVEDNVWSAYELVQSMIKLGIESLGIIHGPMSGTMTKDESLVIEEDRFLFVNHKAMEDFTAKLHRYYKEVVDYTLDNRAIVRILLFESLKGVKHESSLFRFMELMEKRLDDPLYRTVQIGQPNFNYHEATVFYEFFFSIIPLVGIAAYYDEYQAKSHLSDERLRELALQSYMAHAQTNNVQKFFVAES